MIEPTNALQERTIVVGRLHSAYLTNRFAAAPTPRASSTLEGETSSASDPLSPPSSPAAPPPSLVLLHGWGAGKGIWVGLLKRLGRGRPAYALDLPGHGGSDPLPGDYNPDALADAAADLLGALGVRDVVVVGHSLGTLVAIALALRHREALGIRAVVLCNPPHPADMRRILVPWRSDRWLSAALDFGRRTYRTLGWRAPADAPGRLAAFRRRAQAYGNVPTPVLLQTARMLEVVDLTPRLAGMGIPTLVTLGRFDLLTPARGGRLIARGIANSRCEQLPTGHEAMDTHEALLADTIEGWLVEQGC